jgi:hypothetical protein
LLSLGILISKRNWTLPYGAKITGSKNQELYEEYKKISSRFRDDNLTLLEQKFNAIKATTQKQ